MRYNQLYRDEGIMKVISDSIAYELGKLGCPLFRVSEDFSALEFFANTYGKNNYKLRICLSSSMAVHEEQDHYPINLAQRMKSISDVLRSYGVSPVIADFNEAGLGEDFEARFKQG